MNTTPSRTIRLQPVAYPVREPITVHVTEETPAFWVGVQVSKQRYPRTVFPKSVWEMVEESEEGAA